MKLKVVEKGVKGLSKAKTLAKVSVSNAKVILARKGPKWGIYAGVGTMIVGAGILAYKTLKLEGVIDEANVDISAAKESGDKKELAKAYGKAAMKVTRLYSVPIAVMIGGSCLILKSYGILDTRILAVESALIATQKDFNDYQNNVKAYVGEEIEQKIRYGMHDEAVDFEYKNPENGEIEKVKDNVAVLNDDSTPTEGGFSWWGATVYPSYYSENLWESVKTCRTGLSNARRLLKNRGYIWENEVWGFLGARPEHAKANGWQFGYILPNEKVKNDRDIGNFDIKVTNLGGKSLDEITIKDIYTYLEADKLMKDTNDAGAVLLNLELVNCGYISDRVEKYILHKENY